MLLHQRHKVKQDEEYGKEGEKRVLDSRMKGVEVFRKRVEDKKLYIVETLYDSKKLLKSE